MTSEHARYVAMIRRMLRHWANLVTTKSDLELFQLLKESNNLQQTIQEALGYPELSVAVAETLLVLFTLIERQRLEFDWERWFSQSLAQLNADQPHLKARLLQRLGQLKIRRATTADRLEAVALFQEMISLAQALDDGSLEAHGHFHLANAFLELKQLQKARAEADIAADLVARFTDSIHMRANLNGLLGELEAHLGQFEAAAAHFTTAAELFAAEGQLIEQARVLNNMGNALNNGGKYREAITAYQQAETLFRQVGSPAEFITLQTNMASAYYRSGDLQQAFALYQAVDIDYLRATDKRFSLGIIHQSLGNIAMLLDRLEFSQEQLNLAIGIWRDIGGDAMLANSLGTRGQCYARSGQSDLAARDLAAALTILTPLEQQVWNEKLICEFSADYEVVTGQAWRPDPPVQR